MHVIYDNSLTTNKTKKKETKKNQLNSHFSVIFFKYKMYLPLTRSRKLKIINGKSF